MAKAREEVDLLHYAVVSTGGRSGHLVASGESSTLCGKGTGRMPWLRDWFEPGLDCPEFYRRYRERRKRLGWRKNPWGWTSTRGRSRWMVKGPILGLRVYWLYRDGSRYTPTGSEGGVVCFRSAGSARACAERLEEAHYEQAGAVQVGKGKH